MGTTSESGHAKKMYQNFDELIAVCTTLGATIIHQTSIKVAGLQSLSTTSKTALTAVNQLQAVLKNASAARDVTC